MAATGLPAHQPPAVPAHQPPAVPAHQPRGVPAPDQHGAATGPVGDAVVVADPVRHRTLIVDADFLRSNHRCIYGAGCQGIGEEKAPELGLGCCSVGAQLVDDDDVQTLVRSFVRLRPGSMQHHDEATRNGFLRSTDDGRSATRVVDGACIFLNRPGFAGGVGCALHLGAIADGDRPVDRKPNVCWQVPIRAETHVDAHGHTTTTVRRWAREDWGGELAWWCTEAEEAPEAFTGDRLVLLANRDELVELVGPEAYELIRDAVLPT